VKRTADFTGPGQTANTERNEETQRQLAGEKEFVLFAAFCSRSRTRRTRKAGSLEPIS